MRRRSIAQTVSSHSQVLIDKGSKRTGIDLNYFVKGGTWVAVGQAYNILRSLVLSVLLTSILPREIFGQYTFIMSVLGSLMIFSLPGMKQVIIKSVARGEEGTYFEALRRAWRLSWLGSLALLGFAAYGAIVGSPNAPLIFISLAAIFPLYSTLSMHTSYYLGRHEYEWYTKVGIIGGTISLGLIFVALVWKPSLFWIVLATVASQTIFDIIVGWWIPKKRQNRKTIGRVNKADIKFGNRLSIVAAITTVGDNLTSLLMPIMNTFSGLGILTVALKIPSVIQNTFKSFSNMILPKLASRKDKPDPKKTIRYFFILLGITLITIPLVAFIAVPIGIRVLYPGYVDAIPYAQALSFMLIALPNTVIMAHLTMTRDIKWITKSTIINRIIATALILILLPLYGIWGAVFANIIPEAIQILVNITYLMKKASEKTSAKKRT